ncbi:HemK family protein methyltransferase [Planomonospora sp. ID82291]|nr:HemK family protein methyltransferase [Planomonospora sp. ID82291]MBG0814546.1 HemK family protein methyltransferase [Planomonospora sp. ID82291]
MPPAVLSAVVARLRAAGCVFAEDEADLLADAARTPADLTAMVERRVAGLPLEHVLGWAEFCGLRTAVDPGVFVPRRRTEFLVHRAAALTCPGAVVVDLCCGSGALGAALASLTAAAEGAAGRTPGDSQRAGRTPGDSPRGPVEGVPDGAPAGVELHAADIDPAAVACARRNLAALGGRVYRGDLYEPLPAALRGRVDVLLANVPYVPTGEITLLPPEARLYEARVALDGGADGLAVLRRVAAGAPRWLAPGGRLLFETSERQVASAVGIVTGEGLVPEVAVCEELDATVVVATRPPGPATGPGRAP